MKPSRIHLIAPANPLFPDASKLGFHKVDEYVDFARAHVPAPYRVTYNRKVMSAAEDEWHGGRNDDAARVRDLQEALADPDTLALVATNGGAYLTRILPHVDFSPLQRRRAPLWALGFSELTTLVNLVASYRCGRGLYWLGPNFLGWRIRPVGVARAALAEFWQALPDVFEGCGSCDAEHLDMGPIRGHLVAGKVGSGPIRIVGGCLAVLMAATGGAIGHRLRPDGKWLMFEDLKEAPYRIDRHLAALKLAGWFERVAGILVGDFHIMNKDVQDAVLELLKYHIPPRRNLPVVTTRSVGHVWPLVPVLVNRPLPLENHGGVITIWATGVRTAIACR